MSILKTMFAWFFFLLVFSGAAGQGYDRVWAVGTPVATMTFDGDSVINGQLVDSMTLSFNTLASICDSSGHFLCYSNGLAVYNRYGQIMPHGDSLSYPSPYYQLQQPQGQASSQGVLILPKPGDTNFYYLFHYTSTDTDFTSGGYEATHFYYSVMDIRADSGRGDIVKKNVPLLHGEILSASRLAACRHANGRDWWIVKPAWHENIYYKFLLTPDTILGPFIQQIGPIYGAAPELPSYSTFSQDGSKYASVTAESFVVVMDFDRCTGLFSNPDSIYNRDTYLSAPSGSGGVSLAFSPNGRFLYVDDPIELNQYDLFSMRINDSVKIMTDTNEFYQMNILQLGSNGKIYLSCWAGGSYAMHVINQPDSLGLACDFQLFGQPTSTQSPVALPYFPNFRLGAIAGCDTIPNSIRDIETSSIKIAPNPASGMVTISYPPHGSDGWSIELYDNVGEVVYSVKEQAGADKTSIDVSAFAAGMYVVRVTAGSGVFLNAKVVVVR